MGSKPKKPKEDPASIALRKRQTEQLLELDEEQNVRVRRMYNASTGMRSFRGSSDTRLPQGDSAASPGTGNYGLEQSTARSLSASNPRRLAGSRFYTPRARGG
jgi:hypothetical protein